MVLLGQQYTNPATLELQTMSECNYCNTCLVLAKYPYFATGGTTIQYVIYVSYLIVNCEQQIFI